MMDTRLARANMIEQQIRPWNVLDTQVLETLERLPREHFVPQGMAHLAYADVEIPLPSTSGLAHMLCPKVEARMLQDLQLQNTDEVLEIGTGSGYMAALLGAFAVQVTSYEIDPQLARMAQQHLRRQGMEHVQVVLGNGAIAVPAGQRYSAILLSGSVEILPPHLLSLLKPGGRLLAIVGQAPVMQAVRVTRNAQGVLHQEFLWDTVAERLLGFEEVSRFVF